MERRMLSAAVSHATLLLMLAGVRWAAAAKQCMCSDMNCINSAIDNSSSVAEPRECCLWDFPPNRAVGVTTDFELRGYAFGRTTVSAPRFCISYPVPDSSLHLKSYFLVKLDLQGPDVCISEPGITENKSCSSRLESVPVKKADYCSGVAVMGVQYVNFSVDCLECSQYEAYFQFRVYSESFNTSQDHWCDEIDRSVPSEHYFSSDKPTTDKTHTGKGDGKDREEEEETDEETEERTSGSQGLSHILPALTLLLSAATVTLTA